MSLITSQAGIITITNQFPTFQSRKHKSQSKIKEMALLSNVKDTSVTTKNKQKNTYVTWLIFKENDISILKGAISAFLVWK